MAAIIPSRASQAVLPTMPIHRPAQPMWDRIARLALLTAIFLSGWGLLRLGSMNLTLADIMLLLCLLITGMRGRLGALPFGALTAFWLTGLVMMLGGLFVGSVINGDPMRWVNIALQYGVSFLLIPMLLMQQDERTTRIAPLMFVLGVTLSQVIGIAATFFVTYHETQRWLGDGFITGNGRLGSMAGQPNPNGAVIAFSLPMLFYCMRQQLLSAASGFACLLLLLWGLMLTASFTGFVASLVAIFACLALMGAHHVRRMILLVAVTGGLLFASSAPLPKAFQERVARAVESSDISQAGTFVDRRELIDEAWGFAEQYSIVGMGVDRYRELSAHDNPVHNLYLLIWNEGGALAFVGLVILLTLLCLMAAMGLRLSRPRGAMAAAVMLVFLIYTLSYPHMYSRMWVLPVMVALAALHAPRRQDAPGAAKLIYDNPVGPQQLPSF